MNACQTRFQKNEGITDDSDTFYEETLAGGNRTNDPDLLRYFVDQSASAVDWLDQLGVRLSSLTTTGGMTVKRTHRPSDGSAIGGYLVQGLLEATNQRNIEMVLNARVTGLIQSQSKRVDGVEYIDVRGRLISVKSGAVIIATGGFGSNYKKIREVRSDLAKMVTTNHVGSSGDGIDLIKSAGGALRDLDKIQVHPTVHHESRFLVTEALRGEGAILVNKQGKRFVNEMDRRDVVSKAIGEQIEGQAFLIFDVLLSSRVPAVRFYDSKGMLHQEKSLRDLAEEAGIDGRNLENTIRQWNQAVTVQRDIYFNRVTGLDYPILKGPFFGVKVSPGIHHTMGGAKISTQAEVLNSEGLPLPGLYAAGETVGGLHGENRIGGNAIAEIVIFGRQAGRQAAAFTRNL
ncbi:Fumarate reductase flavoprotein subunit [Alkalibacterium sp. AK22]|nr:flavocytochrome c [Alkalibacterium sp. AK22]EXJ24141.1 Fumarate reductase flavoprotein subunit [Alkalibacterium sp. AK22]